MSRVVFVPVLAGVLLVSLPGCDSEGIPARAEADAGRTREASDGPPTARSPADVARLLQSLHHQRAYEAIAALIVEDRRQTTIELLQAIDEVMDANAALQAAAERCFAAPKTDTWNLAAMENNLGVFSARVRFINQRLKGGTAIVTLQEGNNVPLVRAAFVAVGGEWFYRPEQAPSVLAVELRRLGRILRDVDGSVQAGAPFSSYFDAFIYRVLPQMQRVATAKDKSPQSLAARVEAD